MKDKMLGRFLLSLVMVVVFGAVVFFAGNKAYAEGENPNNSTGSSILPADPTSTPMPTINPALVKLSKTSSTLAAKKTLQLTVTGADGFVAQWVSSNPSVAKVSLTGKVTAVKKGFTVITAKFGGYSFSCNVKVVAAMSKKDFSKFNSENFVSYCKRNGYTGKGWCWNGQWKGGSKKKKTYRGIKIGMTAAKVASAYGDFTLKKISKKDPFPKFKGLKKNKVKTYSDATYGKYRIRFYYNSKKKIVAIMFTRNAAVITKKEIKNHGGAKYF